jgi:hypothetical protein
MKLAERAIWIVCIQQAYAECFDIIIEDQETWTCNRSMRFWEDWSEELYKAQ